jgi:hypothetical protein
MTYAVEMGSGAMVCTPSFIEIGSGIQTLIGRDSQTDRQTDSMVISWGKWTTVFIFILLSLYWKTECRLMRSPCCLCVCKSLPINFWIPERIFIKLHMYIMAPETISKAYFINAWRQSVYPSYHCYVKHGLDKHVPAAMNTRNHRRIVGRVCLWICLCIPLSLLGNNLVKTFPRQLRIVGDVVLYAVRVVSEESRGLVIPRTCFKIKRNRQRNISLSLLLHSCGTVARIWTNASQHKVECVQGITWGCHLVKGRVGWEDPHVHCPQVVYGLISPTTLTLVQTWGALHKLSQETWVLRPTCKRFLHSRLQQVVHLVSEAEKNRISRCRRMSTCLAWLI